MTTPGQPGQTHSPVCSTVCKFDSTSRLSLVDSQPPTPSGHVNRPTQQYTKWLGLCKPDRLQIPVIYILGLIVKLICCARGLRRYTTQYGRWYRYRRTPTTKRFNAARQSNGRRQTGVDKHRHQNAQDRSKNVFQGRRTPVPKSTRTTAISYDSAGTFCA